MEERGQTSGAGSREQALGEEMQRAQALLGVLEQTQALFGEQLIHFRASVEEAYELAGRPYGDDPQGQARWLAELKVQAESRQVRRWYRFFRHF